MRIITRKRLDAAAQKHAKAASTIYHWHAVASKAVWRSLVDARKTFPHADQVKVTSGRLVTVFNLTNAHRLITAIHYNRQCIYILKVLTHAEYDKNGWKTTL
ncbi:MAG: type II toxin-antitoxin system HigB family toxin [Opitutaceae bacterium]|jgi:mRNA interferase HigB